jgi:hypothetical protein
VWSRPTSLPLNKKTIEARAMQNHRPSDASGDSGVTNSGSSGVGVADPRGIRVSIDVMV